MTRHTKRQHFPKRTALGLLAVMLVAGFYLITAQVAIWHMTSAGVPVNQPAKQLPCTVPDAKYCSLLRRLVPAVEVGDFSQLLANQVATPVVCPNSAADLYCTNSAASAPITLFTVYQAGQPKLLMRNDYIAFFRSYETRLGKFTYQTPPAGEQNPVLFRNPRGTVDLELQLHQIAGGDWQFVWPVVVQ